MNSACNARGNAGPADFRHRASSFSLAFAGQVDGCRQPQLHPQGRPPRFGQPRPGSFGPAGRMHPKTIWVWNQSVGVSVLLPIHRWAKHSRPAYRQACQLRLRRSRSSRRRSAGVSRAKSIMAKSASRNRAGNGNLHAGSPSSTCIIASTRRRRFASETGQASRIARRIKSRSPAIQGARSPQPQRSKGPAVASARCRRSRFRAFRL